MAEEELPRTQSGTTVPSLNLAATAAPSRRGRGLSTGQMALMTFAALVMGVLALLRVDSSALGDLGLVSVVGPVYFVAVALILVSFGFPLCLRCAVVARTRVAAAAAIAAIRLSLVSPYGCPYEISACGKVVSSRTPQ